MRHSGAYRTNLSFQPIGESISLREFAEDVRQGLSRTGQKELYSKYLYDEVGSALFDVITVLPEYGLYRADARLLRKYSATLAAQVERPSLVIELGSGSGSKTRWFLSRMAAQQPITYCPVDISESALSRCCMELGFIDSVRIVPFAQSYLEGLEQAVRLRPPGTAVVVLFLGSTIGNFEPDRAVEFLKSVRGLLCRGDVFYLSADLVKDCKQMVAAYDDAIGATAAFNLNLLARINRELGGDFVLSRFRHRARYNEKEHRIEMHLESLEDQTVAIGHDFRATLNRGETIWTESSYKFRSEDLIALAERTRFHCEAQWIDKEWPFAQSLFRAV